MNEKEKAPELSFQCPKLWEKLTGSSATRRFCAACGHSVHNLSTLSESERIALIEKSRDQRVCVAYYKNLVGDLLTSPPADQKKRTATRIAAVAAAAGAIALSSCSSGLRDKAIPLMGIMCPPEEGK